MADRLLLDTCAIIWISQDEKLDPAAMEAIAAAESASRPIYISIMSAWEVGMLMSKGRLASSKPPLRWFNDFIENSSVVVQQLNVDVMIASSFLPTPVHNDPMDRILIATAREHELTIVTRDKAILAYGASGHVRTLAC
ncbi:MAG: type II toxin-antitoxin system VapC family toxin [Rhizobiaceae bacterium]